MERTLSGKIVGVTGASGLIGRALVAHLEGEGAIVRPFVRPGARTPGGAGHIPWDPAAGTVDDRALEGTEAVVHLAGETVVGLWTTAKKERIRRSRVMGSETLAKALARMAKKPAVLVSASAIGFYPDVGDRALDETAAPGDGFLAEVCQAWEAAAAPAREAGVRVVHLRLGLVLTPKGGALEKMLPPFKLGLGGVMGPGTQYMSWIALDDVLRAITFALTEPTLSGPVNATAPTPVTNREFTKALGATLGRPTLFPVPATALKLALGEFATELLTSHRVLPAKLEAAGFTFQHRDLASALPALMGASPTRVAQLDPTRHR